LAAKREISKIVKEEGNQSWKHIWHAGTCCLALDPLFCYYNFRTQVLIGDMAAENMEQDSIILSKRKATKDHDDVSHDEDDEDLKYLAVGILLGVKIALFCCI